ncbi:N-carbamoyl-D-amino acid hydrolase [Rubripirellula lacrimiformis]|uniref:N-carbamoyl-D-amino acid hydrolase n=1 Tax=Rubripirellula lacrimiformis TaxID=1930273 RepID=A0A517N8N6_9BACT|nr:carbon-nitrogen hydrolase family protein [Rubripirellula lacrimiformis]QDT03358.1 N-carbamoyl-D-amino acid hydrolase [Rubripirellula lacrimiformis]
MKIACVQTDVVFADIAANVARVLKWMELAGRANADLVVFPECMLCGYGYEDRQEAAQQALSMDSPVFASIAQSAAEHQLNVTLGFLEADGDRLFNSSALIGPKGVVGNYRKIHLPHIGVDRFVDRGDIPYRTLAAREANVGLAICYDSSFPEPIRILGLEGADVIALGTNWPVTASRTAEIVPAARSMENHLFFVAANRVGTERGFEFCGMSSICGPDGVVLVASPDAEETMLMADIDLAEARNKRIERTAGKHVIHRMNDRRPEFYDRISQPNDSAT